MKKPSEIIDSVVEIYSSLNEYTDQGTATVETYNSESVVLKFSTLFRRSHSFEFKGRMCSSSGDFLASGSGNSFDCVIGNDEYHQLDSSRLFSLLRGVSFSVTDWAVSLLLEDSFERKQSTLSKYNWEFVESYETSRLRGSKNKESSVALIEINPKSKLIQRIKLENVMSTEQLAQIQSLTEKGIVLEQPVRSMLQAETAIKTTTTIDFGVICIR